MYCIIVKNVVKPGTRDQYLAAMRENAQASVRDEPGCLIFDVLEAQEEENTFYLYEVYDDKAALAAHKGTPHYKASRPIITKLVAEQSVIRADVLALNPAR